MSLVLLVGLVQVFLGP